MSFLSKNKTFYIWLLSYLVVFIIPLVFSLSSYIYSIRLINYESLFHKKTTQNQMKDLVDIKLREIDRITDRLIWDREIRLYLKLDEINQEFRNTIEKKMKELRFLNQYIDQIYIVNTNKTISSGGMLIPENHQSEDIDWVKVSKNKDRSFLYENIDRKDEGKELCLITRFFMIDEEESGIYLVVFINPSLLESSISQIKWIEQGAGFVLDSEANVLSSEINIDIKSSFREDAAGFLNENWNIDEYFEVEKDNHIISIVKSDIFEWYYTIILPVEVYYGKIKQFQAIVFVLLLICLATGVFLSLMFTRRNYLPVLALYKLFNDTNLDRIYQSYINEFDLLEIEIKSMISENISVKKTFHKNKLDLKKLYLRRLLMGEEIEGSAAFDIGSSLGVNFIYENFAVMIIDSTENDSMAFLDLKNELAQKSEALEKEFNCFLLVYSGKNLGILNFEDPVDYTELKTRLEAIAVFLRKDMTEKFIITAGKIFDSIAGISISYSEALQVLDYRNLLGEKKILLFSKLRELRKNRKFQYLSYLEDEYKIYNLLTAGKYTDARLLLMEGIEAIEESYIEIEILKIRLAGFKNILIESLNIILRNDGINLKNFVKKIIGCISFHQFRDTTDYILTELEELSPEKNRSDIVTSAKSFIEKNYNNKNFAVTDIAENLGITTQHLSKIFKEISGTGVLQYINICRIEEAKIILENEPEINIKETAGIVGYYNDITFIRNFKSITGLSPGKYRNVKRYKSDIMFS
jgi:YesN/AraC family two-component response regulator